MATSFEPLTGVHAAPIEELGDVSPGELEAMQDESPLDPRTLYYRWERQQWEAEKIDLEGDRVSWQEGFDARGRKSILAVLSCCFVQGPKAEDLLVPFVDAVPTEDQQVFMTTHLVDTARRTVFFDRFFSEVVHRRGQGSPRETSQLGVANQGVREIVDLISENADEVRRTRDVSDELLAGLLLHDVVLEGVTAATAERSLFGRLAELDSLRGLRTGLAALLRDQGRHVQFAVGFVGSYVSPRDGRGEALHDALGRSVGLVERVFESAAEASGDFESLGFDHAHLSSEAFGALARRVQDLGLDLPT
ncbi:MAG: hypothetical protein M3280_13610 [Actinomycetota bacterium]|nr:hypothetical protein [Actinomycetota bacterium]